MSISSILLLSFLLTILGSLPEAKSRRLRLPTEEGRFLATEEHWFDQRLDHFSATDHRQFKQRYYEFLDYFEDPQSPVFLIIGGEGPAHGISNNYIAVIKDIGKCCSHLGESLIPELISTRKVLDLSAARGGG